MLYLKFNKVLLDNIKMINKESKFVYNDSFLEINNDEMTAEFYKFVTMDQLNDIINQFDESEISVIYLDVG